MIKILHTFSTLDKGGAESRVMDLYRAIDRGNFSFDFAVTSLDEHYYTEEILNMGGKIYNLHSIKELGIFRYIKQWKKLFKEKNYDVVHSHTGFESAIPITIAAFCGVKKRITHSRNMLKPFSKIKKFFCFFMKRLIIWFSTDLVAISTDAGNFLFGKRVMKKRGKHITDAIKINDFFDVDINLAEYKEKLGINSYKYVLGTVGNLRKIKNQEFMIRVFHEFLKSEPNSCLLIAGSGDELENLQKTTENLSIADKVIFLGQCNEVPKLLKVLSLFLLTSVTEGLADCVIEAQAANVKCLVSTGVPKDVDAGAGLVEYESLNSPVSIWAEKIKKMLDKPLPDADETVRLLKKANFNIDENVKLFEALYIGS